MVAKETYPKVYLYRRIVQAKLFIDSHYAEKIDLDNIAGEAAFSKFHFIRLFADVYKRTPHQYLTYVRIEKARQLLTDGLTIADTCYTVGFESISTFSGLFKKLTGQTPAVYQAEKLARLAAIKKTPLTFIPNCFAEMQGFKQYSNFEEAVK